MFRRHVEAGLGLFTLRMARPPPRDRTALKRPPSWSKARPRVGSWELGPPPLHQLDVAASSLSPQPVAAWSVLYGQVCGGPSSTRPCGGVLDRNSLRAPVWSLEGEAVGQEAFTWAWPSPTAPAQQGHGVLLGGGASDSQIGRAHV